MEFKCRDCQAQDLHVIVERERRFNVTSTLECRCGAAEDGIAASYRDVRVERVRQTFALNENHRFNEAIAEPEQLDRYETEEEREVFCQSCLEEATELDWEVEEADEHAQGKEEYYVRCAGCNRDIEFGWSHPERGGRDLAV